MVKKHKAILQFTDDQPHEANTTFTVSVNARALFRVRRFKHIDDANKLSLVQVFVGCKPQKPYRPQRTSTPAMFLMGVGANLIWDTAQTGVTVSLVFMTTEKIDKFFCVIEGEAAPSPVDEYGPSLCDADFERLAPDDYIDVGAR